MRLSDDAGVEFEGPGARGAAGYGWNDRPLAVDVGSRRDSRRESEARDERENGVIVGACQGAAGVCAAVGATGMEVVVVASGSSVGRMAKARMAFSISARSCRLASSMSASLWSSCCCCSALSREGGEVGGGVCGGVGGALASCSSFGAGRVSELVEFIVTKVEGAGERRRRSERE